MAFKIPDKYNDTPFNRVRYCLRYQEYQHEQCLAKVITEAERAKRVAESVIVLLRERENCKKVSINPVSLNKGEVYCYNKRRNDESVDIVKDGNTLGSFSQETHDSRGRLWTNSTRRNCRPRVFFTCAAAERR